MNSMDDFYGHPEREAPFAGQLDPSFQERLRQAHSDVTPDDCHFYHTLELGNGEVVDGGWDLRGTEQDYLGHVRFDKLKVLEFGPASGYLSFWMEEQGADVTVFDLPPGHPFFSMENVLLSPHTADHVPGWEEPAMQIFLDNFARYRRGEPLRNLVDKELGY